MPLSTLKPGPKSQAPAQAPPLPPDPVPFQVLAERDRPVVGRSSRDRVATKPDEDDIYAEMDRQTDSDIVSAELAALGCHVG